MPAECEAPDYQARARGKALLTRLERAGEVCHKTMETWKITDLWYIEDVTELMEIVGRLAELNETLAEAVERDDEDTVAKVLAEVSSLERRRNRLVHRASPKPSYDPTPSLRDQVIRALGLAGRPASANW